MSLFIFDIDGTLIGQRHVWAGRGPPDLPDHREVRPGALQRLSQLRSAGDAIALACNISLVAYGQMTVDRARWLVEDCARKIGGVAAWRFSPYEPNARVIGRITRHWNPYMRDDPSRKPHPGMLLDLMDQLGCPASDTVMVGDESVDHEAANAAHVRFFSADTFFYRRFGLELFLPRPRRCLRHFSGSAEANGGRARDPSHR